MTRGSDEPGGQSQRPGVDSGGRAGRTESQQTETTSKPRRAPGARRFERVAGNASSSRGKAYQGALEAVFSIVIATLLGYWADQRLGTSPRYLIVGAVVGFASFVLRLMRMASLIEPGAEPQIQGRDGQDRQARNEPGADTKSDSSH